MATNMTFVDYSTIVPADWLNNVNTFVNYTIRSNLAGLRAVPKATVSTVITLGYTTSGDGGGGMYWYNPSDTTSADNGGTIIVANDGGRWYLQNINPISIKQFGALGNGVADDSAAIQAAFNWAATTGNYLYAPCGTYIVNTPVNWSANTHLKLVGAGRENTIFQSNSTTNASVFSFTNGNFEMTDLSLSGPSDTPTGGTLLTTAVDHKIVGCGFLRYYNGLSLSANVGLLDACYLGSEFVNGPNSTASTGILVNGYAGGLNISNCVAFVPSLTPFAGIRILSVGALQIANTNVIRQGTNILIDPPNGSNVASVQISNCFIDSAQNFNIQIAPDTGGSVVRTFIDQTECSSAGASGIQIDGTNGTIDGVLITSGQANFCGTNGITTIGANAKNIDIIGGEFVGSVGAGVSVNTGSSVRAVGVFSGSGYGAGGNGTGFFCDSSSSLVLRNCTGTGNSGNNFSLPSSAIVTNTTGFVSANTGASILPSGGTFVTVNHGLSGTPQSSQIQITPTVSTGSNPLYLDTTSITSTQFTVRCSSAAAADINFVWRATCNGTF